MPANTVVTSLAVCLFAASGSVLAQAGAENGAVPQPAEVAIALDDYVSASEADRPWAWTRGYLASDVSLGFSMDVSGGSSAESGSGPRTSPADVDLEEIDQEFEFSHDFSMVMFHDEPAAGRSDLAAQATNPVAPLIQLQVQNSFVGESTAGSGYSNQFVIQPVIPWKLGSQAMLSRITVPVLVATPDLGDPIGREYGLGDTVAINFATFKVGQDGPWEGMLAVGPAFTFPTATSDFTGEGKFQAGPGFLYINQATKGIQWGVLTYQQWSYASSGGDSDRREVSKLWFQPIFNYHFGDGWYTGWGDILGTYDFNNAVWNLPLSWRLGKVTTIFGHQKANIFVEPFYDVSGNNSGNEWGVKFSISLLFPQS
jgi:hypothetical protein